MRAMQELSFKTKVPIETQVAIESRIKMLEALMYRRMKKNQKFAMEVSMLSNFPVFFEVPAPPPMPMDEKPSGGADLTKIKKPEAKPIGQNKE